MNNLSINPQQSFTGKYRVKFDFNGPKVPANLDRDLMAGQLLNIAENGDKLVEQIRKNTTGALTLDYIIPEKCEGLFENCMRLVGQTFEKLA